MRLFVAISCAGAEKLPMLWATLTSLFPQLPVGTHVQVSYNSEDTAYKDVNDGQGLHTLEVLARISGVTVAFKNTPELSVAQMFAAAATEAKALSYDAIFKIDDDCIVSRFGGALDIVTRQPYVTLNFFDIENTRGYDDWRESVTANDFHKMVDQYGERTIWCHNWTDAKMSSTWAYLKETKVNASLFMFQLRHYSDELHNQLWALGKGQRGMDLVVGTYFANIGRFHSMHDLVLHLGVYRPQLDGKYWKTYNKGAEIMHVAPILNKDNGRGLRLFFGLEVEHTRFFHQQTLFVQGLVDHRLIQKAIVDRKGLSAGKIEHVYLGAGGLSQIDTSLIPKCLEHHVNVTVESVVMPDEAHTVLLSEKVILVIPVSNEGRYQDGATAAVCAWYKEYRAGNPVSQRVYFKIDTGEPHVLIFSIQQAHGLTVPADYAGDVDLISKIEDLDEQSWVD